jgi:hypothetical protein
MTVRKTREQEELEAKYRAIRSFQRRLEDIAWKHEVLLPALDAYKRGELVNGEKPIFEMEPGE